MPSLKDRKFYIAKVCRHCKHCWEVPIEASWDGSNGEITKYYCLLDLSSKEIKELEKETPFYRGIIPEDADLSERFCGIMQVEDIEQLQTEFTYREVNRMDVCDKYEQSKEVE